MYRLLIILWCSWLATATVYNHYKLPDNVRPSHYRLEVITHLEDPNDLRFEGTVDIAITVAQEANDIILHASNLTIDHTQITLWHEGKKDNCVQDATKNAKQEYYIMHLCKNITKGVYQLIIPFSAPLNKNLNGYYKSSYIDKTTGKKIWMASTQFEPTYARRAFPCFDEPALKAKFTLVLGHEEKYEVISNMPEIEKRNMPDREGWTWTEFEETIPMSTYLVAYTVNNFVYKKSTVNLKNGNNVQFKTWARKDALSQVEFAAKVGPRALEYFEEIFEIKFPLPKIDQIAIPDFAAGAMENWGLVTYRETALLFQPNVSTSRSMHLITSVISHELAHQWFGNLVTMKWWTDLWLNEGFATYVATLGVEHLFPEWYSLVTESTDNTLYIFKIDALKSSHPISTPIENANDIFQIFDSISYNKGACVIRMMHLFMGDGSFRSGITHYLKKHSYSNAEQDDLWAALTESAHKHRTLPPQMNIKTIMDSWTLQTGFPIVTITRDYGTGTAEVQQSRYLLNAKLARDTYKNCWWIPLSYTTESKFDFQTLLPKEWMICDDNIPIPKTIEGLPGPNEWVIFNIQLSGLYRVKYDDTNWELLTNTLIGPDYEKIHVVNRAQLISDALDLAWSDDQDYEIAIKMSKYLAQEKDYIPWKAALDRLGSVDKLYGDSADSEPFKEYVRNILEPIYDHLGGLKDTEIPSKRLDIINQKQLIAGWACKFNVSDCISLAQDYFSAWKNSVNPDEENPVPLNLRSVIYCSAIRNGNKSDWEFLWERFGNSNVASEKQIILSALGCSKQKEVLRHYLELSFDEESGIRKHDSHSAFVSVARSSSGYILAAEYLIENITKIYDYYYPDTQRIGKLLSPLAQFMSFPDEYVNMKLFTEKYKDLFAKSSLSVSRSLETIELNAQWREKNYEELSNILRSYNSDEEQDDF